MARYAAYHFGENGSSGLRSQADIKDMDRIVDEARAHHEKTRGPRYWERPVETTGPRS